MSEIYFSEKNLNPVTARILMPLPDHDYDPGEAAPPWQACKERGWKVEISTEHGIAAEGDRNKLKGPLPGWLSASMTARATYQQMIQDHDYLHPVPYAEIDPDGYDALLLPGGDGLGMHQYLDSQVLRDKVLQFWRQGKLIGAICHGILVLARTIDPKTGCSILYGRKVTAPPASLDRAAYWLDKRLVKHGYIMYDQCVFDEVRASLQRPEDMSPGPNPIKPFVVTDGRLITARWYRDAELFAQRFVEKLQQRMPASPG
jgi:putative intracellular protease/amidase